MPTIWCAISGHGYGHAAQIVPVLHELAALVPGLKAIIRTTVPGSFFQDRLTIPWELQSAQQDVGCIQQGPLKIDVPATWEALARFHERWNERVDQEVAAMQRAKPQVVLADAPYLASQAGAAAGIPTVVLANFTWNEVLEPLMDASRPDQQILLTSIGRAYEPADVALRIAPGLPMQAFRKLQDVGPIAQPAPSRRAELRTYLKAETDEQIVLVGFGGVPLETLPWDRMAQMTAYRFIVDGVVEQPSSRIHGLSSLPFSFKTLLASVDVVMTKPGYGTIVEAVALGLPVVYVRRYNFADEAPLVDYLHRYGRGVELPLDDFTQGRWKAVLQETLTAPAPSFAPPLLTGAVEAAEVIVRYCQG